MYSEVSQALKDNAAGKLKTDIYILRFIKPFNEEYFVQLATEYKGVLLKISFIHMQLANRFWRRLAFHQQKLPLR